MQFNHLVLEEEQKELFCVIVEACRAVPREKREKFVLVKHTGGSTLMHDGLRGNLSAYDGDIEALSSSGLIRLSYGQSGALLFDVKPFGFQYYEYLKQHQGQPVAQVEKDVRSFVESDLFRSAYPDAYAKWADAEQRLWSSESEKELTTVGHLCREAMQEFAEVLVSSRGVQDPDPNKANIVARVRSALELTSANRGKAERAFLDALLTYWGTVSDLVQRQEHGAQKEGEALMWEDARRVVFQTLIVMYELHKAVG